MASELSLDFDLRVSIEESRWGDGGSRLVIEATESQGYYGGRRVISEASIDLAELAKALMAELAKASP